MYLRNALTLVVLAAGFLTACGLGSIIFDSPPRTYAVALADLDGDGDLDAFLANGQNEGVQPNTVWVNDGTGRFSDSGQRLGKADNRNVTLADFDADGDEDALAGDSGWTGGFLEVFHNRGSGRFPSSAQFGSPRIGSNPHATAAGDLDGDGDLDAFVASCCGGAISSGTGAGQVFPPYNIVWLNNGKGAFQDSGQRLGNLGSSAAALGDVDGDGDLDAFIGNSVSVISVSATQRNEPDTVWLNDGHGRFTDSGQLLGQAEAYAVALGDVDGDGDLDAFVGNRGADEVWLNDSLGNFTDSGQALGSTHTQYAALGDLDGDGDLDALTGSEAAGAIWLNDGAGSFTASRQRLGFSSQSALALGDVDGDGDLDIFAGDFDDGVKVWQNGGAGNFTLQH